jgi:hypothetical protein
MEFAAAIGMDALRISLGHRPRNFPVEEVVRWLVIMGREESDA